MYGDFEDLETGACGRMRVCLCPYLVRVPVCGSAGRVRTWAAALGASAGRVGQCEAAPARPGRRAPSHEPAPHSTAAGERFAGSSDPATRAAAAAIRAAGEEDLAEARRAKKAAFDAEYDQGGWRRRGWAWCGGVGVLP